MGGVAEEAPAAYKGVNAVVDAAEAAGLAKNMAPLEPMACIEGNGRLERGNGGRTPVRQDAPPDPGRRVPRAPLDAQGLHFFF